MKINSFSTLCCMLHIFTLCSIVLLNFYNATSKLHVHVLVIAIHVYTCMKTFNGCLPTHRQFARTFCLLQYESLHLTSCINISNNFYYIHCNTHQIRGKIKAICFPSPDHPF